MGIVVSWCCSGAPGGWAGARPRGAAAGAGHHGDTCPSRCPTCSCRGQGHRCRNSPSSRGASCAPVDCKRPKSWRDPAAQNQDICLQAGVGPSSSAAAAAAAAESVTPRSHGMSTRILHPARKPTQDPYNAVSPPLYQTATFGQPGATEGKESLPACPVRLEDKHN